MGGFVEGILKSCWEWFAGSASSDKAESSCLQEKTYPRDIETSQGGMDTVDNPHNTIIGCSVFYQMGDEG
jgi:hypothetical protein